MKTFYRSDTEKTKSEKGRKKSKMEACFEEYMERSTQIRRLSMPPEGTGGGPGQFYRAFNENFNKIKKLLGKNREILDRLVYRPLNHPETLTPETAEELMAFSDALADTRTLEMVDVRLAWLIADMLESFYENRYREGDTEETKKQYIHCLFRRQVLSYNVGQVYDRGRATDLLTDRYKDCILECARKAEPFWRNLDYFEHASEQTKNELMTMSLFRATGYERAYYDEELVRAQIDCYEDYLSWTENPELEKRCPEIDWEFEVFSGYSYLSAVQEFLYWENVPEDILKKLELAVERAEAYVRAHPDNFRTDLETMETAHCAIDYYLGRTDFSKMVCIYEQWEKTADPAGYDRENVNANLLSVIFVLWMCRKHPEEIEANRAFLLKAQKLTFAYIRNARDRGTYDLMQRYTGYIMDDYIELSEGISFREYYENILITTQPTLYVHCSMVARIASSILDEALRLDPELLLYANGYETVEKILSHADELRTFLYECCFFHDAGKLFFLDTINLYSRQLFSEEFELIRLHPLMGWELLSKRESTRKYADAALYHHLWYDEKGGYPMNLTYQGNDNAFLYQIITCADCIDAATDSVGRAYSRGKDFAEMMDDLRSNSGRMFRPEIVGLFENSRELQRKVEYLITAEREKLYKQAFSHEYHQQAERKCALYENDTRKETGKGEGL